MRSTSSWKVSVSQVPAATTYPCSRNSPLKRNTCTSTQYVTCQCRCDRTEVHLRQRCIWTYSSRVRSWLTLRSALMISEVDVRSPETMLSFSNKSMSRPSSLSAVGAQLVANAIKLRISLKTPVTNQAVKTPIPTTTTSPIPHPSSTETRPDNFWATTTRKSTSVSSAPSCSQIRAKKRMRIWWSSRVRCWLGAVTRTTIIWRVISCLTRTKTKTTVRTSLRSTGLSRRKCWVSSSQYTM